MKEAFKAAYERELKLLKERSAQFANEFPALAGRLGGLMEENLDPSIQGLLEGSAFLAARVQLNIDEQFRTFSRELLEQLCPEATAPLPSAMLVQAKTSAKPEELATGRRLSVGEYIEASFSQPERRISCRFRLSEPVDLWPLSLPEASFHDPPTPLSKLLKERDTHPRKQLGETVSGLVLRLSRTDGQPMETLQAEALPIHFTSALPEALALYDLIFSRLKKIHVCWKTEFGDSDSREYSPSEVLEQIGFERDLPLFGRDERLFAGFSTLLEYFAFPRKFLGMRLVRLRELFRGISASSVQIAFEFDSTDSRLASHFDHNSLGLFCAPAVNLFEDDAKPIALDRKSHRYLVSPNRTPINNFEVQRILTVRAQSEAHRDKIPVQPLYALPQGDQSSRQTYYYTSESERRSLTRQERSAGGSRFRYEGTETWITLYEPPDIPAANQMFVRTLCSNRHLPDILPMSDATYFLLEDRNVQFSCLSGPSAPREAVAELEREASHRTQAGDNYWRLLSLLSISYRGFVGADGKGNVDALREALRLFSDVSDHLDESQINGINGLSARPITRSVKRFGGYLPTRGLEVSISFDETVFDRGTIILLSAVLNHFFADFAGLNTFTRCVARDLRGQVMKRWSPRGGSGPLL